MSEITEAAKILRAGGLVAFPTETVYGLGADATNSAAVRKIFAAKGRPATNPLISHVADEQTARRYATAWPEFAARLARSFWPGPLTLVVPKDKSIADEATANRPTVALRCPAHPLALQLLQAFGGAVAAPSANRSNRISPTTAAHVREELGDRVELILDGGPCMVGIESTVVDVSSGSGKILRPGAITRDQIEALIGPVRVFSGSIQEEVSAPSPGQYPIHYAPSAPAQRFIRHQASGVEQRLAETRTRRVALLSFGAPAIDTRHLHWTSIMPDSVEHYGRQLYSELRRADRSGADLILIEMPPDEPEWTAIRDRISRATRPWT